MGGADGRVSKACSIEVEGLMREPDIVWSGSFMGCGFIGRHVWRLLGDALLRPTFPPIFLCHLCIFLLIATSPRWSALTAPVPESDDHVT